MTITSVLQVILCLVMMTIISELIERKTKSILTSIDILQSEIEMLSEKIPEQKKTRQIKQPTKKTTARKVIK